MARTQDPLTLSLIFLRYAGLPFFSNSCILDLGCGDGAVLKLLEKLRYRKIAGIELDPFLCRLAKQNSPKSQIIEGNFLHNRSIDEVLALNPRVIYAFNPAPPYEVVSFLSSIISEKNLMVILRNPIAFEAICASTFIDCFLIRSYKHFKVMRLRKA
jgi:SAM-dependent methyltransferase